MAKFGIMPMLLALWITIMVMTVNGHKKNNPGLTENQEGVCIEIYYEPVTVKVNVTYTYWEWVDLPPEECEDSEGGEWSWDGGDGHYHHGHHHGGGHRHRRTWHEWEYYWGEGGNCQEHVEKIGVTWEWQCVYQERELKFCCDGYEGDPEVPPGCIKKIECSDCPQICYGGDYPKCDCMEGYELRDGKYCFDINECDDNNGGCAHECNNLQGTYMCSCLPGYDLDFGDCKERNECEMENGGCEQLCHNTPGHFYCDCEPGFKLTMGKICDDINECETFNAGCSHECKNHFGGFECLCPEGMYLGDDGHTCFDLAPGTHPPTSKESTRTRPPTSKKPTRPVTASTTTIPPIVGEHRSNDDDSASTGLIAGASIGALLLLLLLIVAALLLFTGRLCCNFCCLGAGRSTPDQEATAAPAGGVSNIIYENVSSPQVFPVILPVKKGDDKVAYDNIGFEGPVVEAGGKGKEEETQEKGLPPSGDEAHVYENPGPRPPPYDNIYAYETPVHD